jgi:hypothetical protein
MLRQVCYNNDGAGKIIKEGEKGDVNVISLEKIVILDVPKEF